MRKMHIKLIISFLTGVGLTVTGILYYSNSFFYGLTIIGICILLGITIKIMDELIDEIKIKSYKISIITLVIFISGAMVYLALNEEPVIGMVIGTAIGLVLAGKLDHPAYVTSVVLFIILIFIAFVFQLINIETTTYFIIPVAAVGSFLDEFGHERWKSKKKYINFIFKHRFFLKIFVLSGVILDFAQPIHFIGFLCFDIFYDLIEITFRGNTIPKNSISNKTYQDFNNGEKNA